MVVTPKALFRSHLFPRILEGWQSWVMQDRPFCAVRSLLIRTVRLKENRRVRAARALTLELTKAAAVSLKVG